MQLSSTLRLIGIASVAMIAATAAVAQAPATTAQVTPPQAKAEPLFAIIYRAGPAWKANVPMRDQGLLEHFYYIRDQHRAGRIIVAGPLGAEGGLVLVRAADQAAAEALMKADPAVTAGKFVGTVSPFTARFPGTVG
ncbi:YciI family protein [Sphingoaurantiacus capsulatus]|uniref:YciI family protein n=1 Tax=Sphingoaurantiacus capsulatus TaxID=1771310 RepID=A0ABV7XDV4_9SPHN